MSQRIPRRRAVQRAETRLARIEKRIGSRRVYKRRYDGSFEREFTLEPKRRILRAVLKLARAQLEATNRAARAQ